MSDLAAFLRVRLDEDEAAAKAAAHDGGVWTQDDPKRYPGSISSAGGPVVYDEGSPDERQAPHIARHDPARVLRDVAAKREVIDLYESSDGRELPDGAHDGRDPDEIETDDAVKHVLYDVVLQLAEPWSEHPDFDAKWREPW